MASKNPKKMVDTPCFFCHFASNSAFTTLLIGMLQVFVPKRLAQESGGMSATYAVAESIFAKEKSCTNR